MAASLATAALYFRVGLESGVLQADQARAWAIAEIERMDEPPGEMIDISWQQPLAQLIADLKAVQGEGDPDLACRALLGVLREHMQSADADLDSTLLKAMMVTSMFEFTDRFDTFNSIDDQLQQAVCGTFGTVQECREDFDNAMKEDASAALAW
ncbi:hypothetical protein [Massilia sp. CCM 8734]|uniref:hypothetical protein n=1 Tax=Massilia sp. CCM 8734 TaxID=2609283 RepID=UPI00141F50C3|nr:hypothetical protein [Massilia sp. CCM 8734]NHZ96425.1 hypothetical protein [Massilia sp. CCM 8734]